VGKGPLKGNATSTLTATARETDKEGRWKSGLQAERKRGEKNYEIMGYPATEFRTEVDWDAGTIYSEICQSNLFSSPRKSGQGKRGRNGEG